MTLIPFNVSARTAQLIGQQNFSSAEGAVIELVKNCYDADSKVAIVLFDNFDADESKHSLYIIDCGDGMTQEIIRNHWMTIGTDNKEDNYSTISGRVKTGAKGIGRFALDRLGEVAEMYTFSKKAKEGSFWSVNWNDFSKKNISISDVKARLEPLSLREYVQEFTRITSFNPRIKEYLSANKTSPVKGTIIKISKLRERWETYDLDSLFQNLEILIPPLEQPTFSIGLFANINPLAYGPLNGVYFDDFDYRLSAEYIDDKTKTVKITIKRNELDLKKVEKEYAEVFTMKPMQHPRYTLNSFKKNEVSYNVTLFDLVKGQREADRQDLIDKIGKFKFSFYYLKNTKSDDKSDSDVKKYPYKDFNSTSRKAWLKKFGGIKIFRDDFRVRPYGEFGEDWLKLGERQAQNPQGAGQRLGAYRIRPNQISGTVLISRLTNLSFQDKSGREGLQENDVFDLFKSILIGLIEQFERDRNTIMYSFSELSKIRNQQAEAIRKAQEEAARILAEQEAMNNQASQGEQNKTNEEDGEPTNDDEADTNDNNGENSNNGPSETEVTLALGLQSQSEELEEKDNEIRLLRSLSGTGLIVASFAHELRSLRTLLVSRTEELKTIIEDIVDKKTLNDLPNYKNPISMVNHMREQDVQIKHWLDYSLSALRRDKRTRANIDIAEYFSNFKESWINALNRRHVNLQIENKLKKPLTIRGFAIDLDTVYNNLLINSLDSFKRRKDNTERKVTIVVDSDEANLVVHFSDSGAGLSKDYHKNPDEIFEPFETSKVDKRGNKVGTGIGMYLAKTIIDDYNGSIEIIEISEGFKLEISIPLRK